MKKRRIGAPAKKPTERKQSMTCSVTPKISDAAIKHFESRGKAIELAVKYKDVILESENKTN